MRRTISDLCRFHCLNLCVFDMNEMDCVIMVEYDAKLNPNYHLLSRRWSGCGPYGSRTGSSHTISRDKRRLRRRCGGRLFECTIFLQWIKSQVQNSSHFDLNRMNNFLTLDDVVPVLGLAQHTPYHGASSDFDAVAVVKCLDVQVFCNEFTQMNKIINFKIHLMSIWIVKCNSKISLPWQT